MFIFCGNANNKSNNNTIALEYFSIKNPSLDSIVSYIITNSNIKSLHDNAIVLDFIRRDNRCIYYLSFQKKKDLTEKYILWQNRRIVGYTYIKQQFVILLSNVNNHNDFIRFFAPDIVLGDSTKKVDYIYIPEKRYQWMSDDSLLPWNKKSQIYEPLFFICWQGQSGQFNLIGTNSPETEKIPAQENDIIEK